jgi:Sulfotransferase domain
MTPRTDFFIAGWPRCGTTALFSYLAAHPGVFIPACKEPNHFCSDIDTGGERSPEHYRALYDPAPAGALTGDASAMYMYSEVAIGRIMDHNPAARIIVTLRHPVEAALSLYSALRGEGHEDAASFERAWALQGPRMQGEGLPSDWPDPKTLQYGAIYRYAGQLRRLMAQVPKSQYRVLVYEEFFAEPAQQFAQLLRFLELPDDPARTSFPVINPATRARSQRLQRLLNRPSPWLTRLAGPLRSLANGAGLHPGAALARANRTQGKKPRIRPAFAAQLEAHFAPDIAESEQLLGRRLWPPRARAPR